MEGPLVSVLMPVRLDGSSTSSEYLSESVSSILKQTYRCFEFIIVDGSPEENADSVLALEARDRRIKVIREERRAYIRGFTANALNQGCRIAQGKYIARMDSDDLSLPNRLQLQVRHLEKCPNTGAVGTWVGQSRERGKAYTTLRAPTNPELISWSLIFGNCVTHSSVMMRRDTVMSLGYYREVYAEDYDLWARMTSVSKISILPNVLSIYRMIHAEKRLAAEKKQDFEIKKSIIARIMGFSPPQSHVRNLFDALSGGQVGEAEGNRAVKLISDLHIAFEQSHSGTTRAGRDLVLKDAEAKAVYLVVMAARTSIAASINIYKYARTFFPGISMLPRVALTRERAYALLNRPISRWPMMLGEYVGLAKWKSG